MCRKAISSKKQNVHTRVKYLLRYLCLYVYTYLHYLHLDNANVIPPAPAPQVCSCTSLALIPPALFFPLHPHYFRHVSAHLPTKLFNTYGRWAFSVAGPMAWNSLPHFILDPTSSTDCCRRLLKTYLFARY